MIIILQLYKNNFLTGYQQIIYNLFNENIRNNNHNFFPYNNIIYLVLIYFK